MRNLFILLTLLLFSACGSAPTKVEATTSRSGEVSLTLPSHYKLRQVGQKRIESPLFSSPAKHSYLFRPGTKRVVIFFNRSYESDLVGLESYESPLFELQGDFSRGEKWHLEGPHPESRDLATSLFAGEQLQLYLENSQGEKLFFKRVSR